jgi:hypothetical protein
VLEGHTHEVSALVVSSPARRLERDGWARGTPIAAFLGDAANACVAVTETHLFAGTATALSAGCGFASKSQRGLDPFLCTKGFFLISIAL